MLPASFLSGVELATDFALVVGISTQPMIGVLKVRVFLLHMSIVAIDMLERALALVDLADVLRLLLLSLIFLYRLHLEGI